jgi:hypothetical protein
VILEVKGRDTYSNPQEERIIPIYNKTDSIGLKSFLREEYEGWAGKGKNVEEIWKIFKNIVYESIEHFVPHKILRKNSDPEYYSKEIRLLKRKVRKAYNKRYLGVPYKEKLKHLSKLLITAKKSTQETFLNKILRNEGKCWTDFYKYVKRRKGSRKNVPSIRGRNGRIITDATEKANEFNNYYATVFSVQDIIPQLQDGNTVEPFTADCKVIRRRVKMIGKNKSVGAGQGLRGNSQNGRGGHDSVPHSTTRHNG